MPANTSGTTYNFIVRYASQEKQKGLSLDFLNVKIMTFKTTLPVWYGSELETARNALYSVGSLNRTGVLFPKCKDYENISKPLNS